MNENSMVSNRNLQTSRGGKKSGSMLNFRGMTLSKYLPLHHLWNPTLDPARLTPSATLLIKVGLGGGNGCGGNFRNEVMMRTGPPTPPPVRQPPLQISPYYKKDVNHAKKMDKCIQMSCSKVLICSEFGITTSWPLWSGCAKFAMKDLFSFIAVILNRQDRPPMQKRWADLTTTWVFDTYS